jgi:glycosyltransferase involved in cell wall biosynthesis
MRIGLDVRYLSHGLVGGVHTYLENLLPALLSVATDHQFFLYADAKEPFECDDLPGHAVLRLLPYRSPLSSVYNDFTMARQMARDQVDVVHFLASYGFGPSGARTVVTLQDEINILPMSEIVRGHPKDAGTIAKMTYLHFCTKAALRRADLVITVSEYSKRQIRRHSALEANRIVPIPHACPRDIRRIESAEQLAEVRQRLNLKRAFVLAEAFKNPGALLRAWRRLPVGLRENHEIVFFSRSAQVAPAVHEAVTAGYARLLVRPARYDLSALYSTAEAFVFPSWIEGFGIPLLEAMTCGAPIIASDRGAIPEVVGDAAMIIDAEDDEALANHLSLLLAQPEERLRWRAIGFARAAQFQWRAIAEQVLDCYHRAAL